MPCHRRNTNRKYAIVVRADDPGDTLAHEYLHYVQAHRPQSGVCALYYRLETEASVEDLQENDLLEYEVNRLVYENLKLHLTAEAGILEKVQRLSHKNSAQIAKINNDSHWKELGTAAINARLNAIIALVSSPKEI